MRVVCLGEEGIPNLSLQKILERDATAQHLSPQASTSPLRGDVPEKNRMKLKTMTRNQS